MCCSALGLIAERIAFMPSTGAIIIGLAHALLPYAVLTIMGSLNGINPNLERAAMSLGANRTRTFFHVVLPLSLPGIAGGFILAFSIAISAYATPAILGGPATQVLATAIYGFMTQLLDWSIGAALAVVLIVSSLAAALRSPRGSARGRRRCETAGSIDAPGSLLRVVRRRRSTSSCSARS